MKTTRRIILRTETFERLSFRQTSKKDDCRTFTSGVYKIEISKVKTEAEQIIFDAEFSGLLEITENNQEFRLNIQKIE